MLIFLSSQQVVGQGSLLPFAGGSKNNSVSSIESVNNIDVSFGFGTSYGGYGVKCGYSLFTERKVQIQIGAGYYFEDFMVNGAIKLFLWKNLYTDFKYGMFSRHFKLAYDSDYDVAETARILVGPGMMIGYEILAFKNLGLNAGAGFNYDLKYEQGISYSYDIGILYKF